jgi:thymidylate synthase (FAD)
MPEFVARQFYKHIVGSDYVFKDHAWNEISGRYVEYELEWWKPEHFRKKADNKKQGSSNDEISNNEELVLKYNHFTQKIFEFYKELLENEVCNEQARTILPLNFYTEFYWTASLQAISHFVKLRTDSHAQIEIQEYANGMNKIMSVLYPNSWKFLMEYK